jgi:hypothetical protein
MLKYAFPFATAGLALAVGGAPAQAFGRLQRRVIG